MILEGVGFEGRPLQEEALTFIEVGCLLGVRCASNFKGSLTGGGYLSGSHHLMLFVTHS